MKQPLHGTFCWRRRYWLRVVTRPRIVNDQSRLPGHIRLQTTQECTHLVRSRTGGRRYGVEGRHDIADEIKRPLTLAVPQAPANVFHGIGEAGAFLAVVVPVVRVAFGCLGDMLDAHRQVEQDLVERVGHFGLLAKIFQILCNNSENVCLFECGTIDCRVFHGGHRQVNRGVAKDSAIYLFVAYSFTRLPWCWPRQGWR
jgi:hypothetical protein